MAIGDTLPRFQQLGLQILVTCFKAAAVTGLVVIAAISMDSVVVDELLRIHSYAAGAFLVLGIFFFALHLKYVWSLRGGQEFRSARPSGLMIIVVVFVTVAAMSLPSILMTRAIAVAMHVFMVLIIAITFYRHIVSTARMRSN